MGRTELRGGQIKDDSITGDDVDESTLILDTLRDADGDTKVQIEESADEDKIRFDTAGSERMIIDNLGAVGIGTSSPDRKLDVLDASDPQLRLTHTDGSNYVDLKATAAGDLWIKPSNTNGHTRFIADENASIVIQSADAGDSDAVLSFSVDGGSSIPWSIGVDDSDADKLKFGTSTPDTSSKLTMTTTGEVGVGTTTPTCTLSVGGSYAANITGINSSNDPGSTYSVAVTDYILLINTRPTAQGGIDSAITITLPVAASFAGRVLTFKDAGGYSDTNAITVQRAGSDNIDGVNTSLSIPDPAGWLTFVSDGVANWFEIS